MTKKLNRRSFIVAAGTAGAVSTLDPVSILAQLIIKKRYGVAHAAPNTDKRYIFIQQAAAPGRWMFDLFLNPENATNFVRNPHIATEYVATGNRYTSTRYRLIKVGDVWVPPIWNVSLPAPGGGTRKLRSILRHMIQIRGIDTANAAHAFSQKVHMSPLGAETSVTSLTALGGDTPITAVNVGISNYVFKHKDGLLPVNLTSNGNIIDNLMSAFQNSREGTSFRNKEKSLETEILAAQEAIDAAIAAQPGMDSLKKSAESANELIKKDLSNLDAEWTRLLNKYQSLVNRSLRSTVYPNINDKAIGNTGTRSTRYRIANGVICDKADIRRIINNNTNVQLLAAHFAACEFIILNDLSRTVSIAARGLIGLDFPAQRFQLVDEHSTGDMMSLFLNTMTHGATASCLMELIDVLKTNGLFDKTVIDMSGEFNRKPRANRTGSDHAFKAASVAMYTGQTNEGPHIIGNIMRDNGEANYPGTIGEASGNPGSLLSNGKLTPGHFASTLATLLETPSPVSAAPSLVRRDSAGKIKSRLGKAKIRG